MSDNFTQIIAGVCLSARYFNRAICDRLGCVFFKDGVTQVTKAKCATLFSHDQDSVLSRTVWAGTSGIHT